jgi:hypothetical protein
MKAWLVDGLRRLLRWLDPPPDPPAPHALKDAARCVMQAQDDFPDRRGEHKRRVVLLALRQQFPTTRTRDLALAIELVMQERSA